MRPDTFFKAVENEFGTKVDRSSTMALLDACQDFPLDHAAHVLAEVHHETGGSMQPIKETVMPYHSDKNPSDATVIARLDRAFASGQLTWVKKPYWRNGWFGRGMIQLTFKENYRKLSPIVGVDLVKNPRMALVPSVSAKIAAEGCRQGLFTGKKLSDFNTPSGFDHYGARAIVNGDKHAVGNKIRKNAMVFAYCLSLAGWSTSMDRPLLRKGDRGVFVKDLQVQLRNLGYALGHTDGKFGPRTRDAVMAFQADRDLQVDGLVGDKTWDALNDAEPRPVRKVTEKDLEERGSRTIAKAKKVEKAMTSAETTVAGGLTIGGAIELAKAAEGAEGAIEVAQRLLVQYWPVLLVCGVIFLIARYGKKIIREIRQARVEDAQAGRNLSR